MNIQLREIQIDEKNTLRKMLLVYEQELLKGENPQEYKYLDLYWQESDRVPFFILVDQEIAGFVLVNSHCLKNTDGRNIAEFYVDQAHRRNGIGKKAATQVFFKYKGNWEVRTLSENTAVHFWEDVVSDLTNGNFEKIKQHDTTWKGFIFTFNLD